MGIVGDVEPATMNNDGVLNDEDDESPAEEVRLTVGNTDNLTLPVWTFKMWFFGILFCRLLSFLNQFFSYRTEPLVITQIVVVTDRPYHGLHVNGVGIRLGRAAEEVRGGDGPYVLARYSRPGVDFLEREKGVEMFWVEKSGKNRDEISIYQLLTKIFAMCRDVNGGRAAEKTERYCMAMKVVAPVTLLWIKMSSNQRVNGRGTAVERVAAEKTETYYMAMKVVAQVTLLWIKMSSNRHANG
ncbi:hypothetical protein Nepgr_025521 [Nepenthes gracilis]|uniref:Uncharacterized protein n=1 Tax=Nepenthes gracilis TaxID=150966 RepID=A0AAD3T6G4_NEPGR|nr:hypothetical protein Nepgr_025521 [Nepenthes gracilis]